MKLLEDRYIVVKLKHLSVNGEEAIRKMLKNRKIDTVDCIVCETKWPMYEDVKTLVLKDGE